MGELEEGVVHVVPGFPADPQAAETVEVSNGGFRDPPGSAQARAVRLPAPRDLRCDAALTQPVAVDVVVVASIGIQRAGSAPRPAPLAAHRRHLIDQRQKLGDVVAVTAGQGHP